MPRRVTFMGGGTTIATRRRDARSRHRGGGDGLVRASPALAALASTPRYALGALPGFLAAAVHLGRRRRRRSRPLRPLAESGEAAALEQPAAGPPRPAALVQGGVRQDLAFTDIRRGLKSLHLEARRSPGVPTNTSRASGPPWFRPCPFGGPTARRPLPWGGARPWAERCARGGLSADCTSLVRGCDLGRRRRRAVTLVRRRQDVGCFADYAGGFRSKLRDGTDD